MSSHEGAGNFVLSNHEMSGTTFDVFQMPEKSDDIVSGRMIEIRLFMVLDR